ncbi:GGDEF domain-containing protein [Candidatus Hydrogenedentota bacterium]
MLRRLDTWLNARGKEFLLTASLLLTLGLGFIDYTIGREISFSIFYVGPIIFAAWYCGRPYGFLLSLLSAGVWLTADLSTGHVYELAATPYWNSFVRLAFFGLVTAFLSIAKRRLEMESSMADTDSLTGLANARYFYEKVEEESVRSARYRSPFTLAYIDVDNFKAVNDSQGHDVGDQVLQEVAEVLRDNTRESDVPARLGGDEFAGLFPETDLANSTALIEKLAVRLSETASENNWPVTFSIGSVTFDKPMKNVHEMIKKADNLMYRVKKAGKNDFLQEMWPTPEG